MPRKPAALIALLLSFWACAQAQTARAAGATVESEATSILNKALAAAGGLAAIQAVADFRATGTVEYNVAPAPVQGKAEIWGRGSDQFRFDSELPNGKRSWVVSHGQGAFSGETGKKNQILGHDAIRLGALTFPALQLAAALANPRLKITLAGRASDEDLYDIRVELAEAPTGSGAKLLAEIHAVDYLIDPATFSIAEIRGRTYPLGATSKGIGHALRFGAYRRVNGVAVPFEVSEVVGAAEVWSLELSQVQFNTGFAGSQFDY